MKKYLLFLGLTLHILIPVNAQRKWLGGFGEAWDNPLNWQPAGVPVISDEVVLDNSHDKTGYTVIFPAVAVTIASLMISPDAGNVIKLVIPATNTSSPALIISSVSDAVVLDKGAVFQNASGLTSGQSLRIAGNIRINNGGRYVHQTRSAHANDVVAKLSTAEGTEEGIFEFDIPAASSTISLSNRNFGKLMLSSTAYNSNVAYSGGGSNPVTIRSDLEIGERVSFSIGFANVFSIRRHFIQRGGNFNISNDNNATTVAIAGNILQAGGAITETGTASPVLHLNGKSTQALSFSGGINNNVIIRLENAAGAELKTPLSLPFRLELKSGRMNTSLAQLLTLKKDCSLFVDSLGKSYIEGPLKKEGLEGEPHFLFPVGNASGHRWLALKQATGNFTINYVQQNPYLFSTVMGEGLDHVSSIETWSIDADGLPPASAQVELSFDNLHSGGVTDLATLRIAQLESGVHWANKGNLYSTGSAGSSGSVTGYMINDFSTAKRLFTLGSSSPRYNSLPRNEILLHAVPQGKAIRFSWQAVTDLPVTGFLLESASQDMRFREITTLDVQPGLMHYTYLYRPADQEKHFRIKAKVKDAAGFYSRVIFRPVEKQSSIIAGPSLVSNKLNLRFNKDKNEQVAIRIHDVQGKLVIRLRQAAVKGENRLSVAVGMLGKGVYFVMIDSESGAAVDRFVKY